MLNSCKGPSFFLAALKRQVDLRQSARWGWCWSCWLKIWCLCRNNIGKVVASRLANRIANRRGNRIASRRKNRKANKNSSRRVNRTASTIPNKIPNFSFSNTDYVTTCHSKCFYLINLKTIFTGQKRGTENCKNRVPTLVLVRAILHIA